MSRRDDAPSGADREVPGEDRIAELVRLGGPRGVPAEVRDRARAVAREHWRGRVRQRQRRRRTLALASIAASLVVLAVGVEAWRRIAGGTPATSPIVVQHVVGDATLRVAGDGSEVKASVGRRLMNGTEILTSEGSLLAFLMPTGHSVRVDAGTAVRVVSGSDLVLDHGAIYVDSGHPGSPSRSALTVDTPAGEVRDVGTQYEIRVQDSVRLRVREGTVRITGPAGQFEIREGNGLEIAADGTTARRELDPFGPEWDWIVAVTPMLDLEGRPLDEFLRWLARERGWTLDYADDGLSARASTIILSGSAEGLRIDQALDVVLPTCNLAYSVERGVLTIREDEETASSDEARKRIDAVPEAGPRLVGAVRAYAGSAAGQRTC